MKYHIFYRSQSKSFVAAVSIKIPDVTDAFKRIDIFVEKFLCAGSEKYSVTSRICNSDLGIVDIGDIKTNRDLSEYEDIIIKLKERIIAFEQYLGHGFTYDV